MLDYTVAIIRRENASRKAINAYNRCAAMGGNVLEFVPLTPVATVQGESLPDALSNAFMAIEQDPRLRDDNGAMVGTMIQLVAKTPGLYPTIPVGSIVHAD